MEFDFNIFDFPTIVFTLERIQGSGYLYDIIIHKTVIEPTRENSYNIEIGYSKKIIFDNCTFPNICVMNVHHKTNNREPEVIFKNITLSIPMIHFITQ